MTSHLPAIKPETAGFRAAVGRTAALRAMRSAEVTHAHPEAILGAVAVAVAAAEAGWARVTGQRLEPAELVDLVLAYLIDGRVMTGIVRAHRLLGVSVADRGSRDVRDLRKSGIRRGLRGRGRRHRSGEAPGAFRRGQPIKRMKPD